MENKCWNNSSISRDDRDSDRSASDDNIGRQKSAIL